MAQGKPGRTPLPDQLHQAKLWMAESAKAALGNLAEAKGVSAGMAVTLLIAEKTGMPLEEPLRDINQEMLRESA